jgi:agmatine deiminase
MNLMPPEWAKHERTWIAFPTADYTLGEDPDAQHAARSAWASVANAASEFEPVSVVVNPSDMAIAKKYLSSSCELYDIEINDAWIRDSGPSFVISEGKLKAVQWRFNGWGDQPWATYDKDAVLASKIAELVSAETIASGMVNEGGGFHIDQNGLTLLTETVQLGKERNPGASKAQVELEMSRTIGATEFIWLKRGLTRDYEGFGTLGHVDIVASFSEAGPLLLHDQRNPNHPDYLVCSQIKEQFARAGKEVLTIDAPEVLKDADGFVDYSYINHYVLNNAVLLGSFDDAKDKDARAKLRDAYPDREIVLLDAREIFARGGGIHCITQQQPALVK